MYIAGHMELIWPTETIATKSVSTDLLTWNCTHHANATLRDKIAGTCVAFGVRPPAITTPKRLFEDV